MVNETTAPTRTLPDTGTETETAPGRRLSPATICPDQQSRVVRRIIRELP